MNNRVVITGLGVVAPNATNLESFKSVLYNGISGIQHIPELEAQGFRCQIGGIAIPPEETRSFYTDHSVHKASNFIKLACAAGVEAWENAGLEIPESDSTEVLWDTGVIFGAGSPGVDFLAEKVVPLTNAQQSRRIGGYGILNTIVSGPSIWLSSILGLGNISVGNSMACSTGVDAIIEGYYRIASGRAKRMVVGSTEGYSPYYWASFDAMRVMNSAMNHDPQRASRPMSATANGLVPSSGAGALILESLESALERNAPILAEIKGGVSNNGGQRNGGTATFPSKDGVLRCLNETIELSGVAPENIDLINAHLTSTKGDPYEIRNWASIFNQDHFPIINTTKSIIGHALVGAGSIECVASILQMRDGFVHPSLNCEDLHPEIEAIVPEASIVREKALDREINTVIKASFGFGDVNSAILFEKYKG